MKILMLAEDPNICQADSNARKRMEAYAGLFDELHVVVLTAGNPVLRRWRMYRIACSLAGRVRLDVVSAQGPNEVGYIAYRIARRFRIRLQLQVHTDVLSPWYRKASWKERLRYLLAIFLLPRADCLRVVSQRIRHSLVAQLHIPDSRISVLPIFTDLEPFSHSSPKPEDLARLQGHAFRMIAVGRFVDKEKNFSMLISMMAELVKQEPDVILVLVGDGPDKANYQKQVAHYGLEKQVIIEPWRSDLASFYKCFDVLLISSNYEGWGLVAMEAMAANLPLVMTDVGLAGEVVHDGTNGRVVPVGDATAFLTAILNLYHHPEKRRAFADAAKRTVAEIKPQSEVEYLQLYRGSFDWCTTL